jgi:Tfp pilus assembly protein PilW
MVEAMVSLSICSALLVASGAAFTASASAVQNNTDFTKAGQTARVTMNQMLIEIRRADSVQCPSTTSASTYFDVIRPDETITPNEVFRRYSYDATNKQLKLQIFYAGNAAGPSYVLANNISAGSFGPPQMGTDANNTTVVQRLPITMTATVGKNAVPLSGSEGPRRALKY